VPRFDNMRRQFCPGITLVIHDDGTHDFLATCNCTTRCAFIHVVRTGNRVARNAVITAQDIQHG
jgi:hypothetical protein